MLLVDKLNKGRHPDKPENPGEPPVPSLASLVVKPQNLAARIPNLDKIKKTIHERLLTTALVDADKVSSAEVLSRIGELVDVYCEETRLRLPRVDRDELVALIGHDVLGLGPLETLLIDGEVTEDAQEQHVGINGYGADAVDG